MSKAKAQRVVLVELIGTVPSFNLPHHQYCAQAGACSCRMGDHPVTDRAPVTGARVRSTVRLRRPKTITLAPRGKSEPLHPAALQCDEIAAALKSSPRRIRYEPV